MSAGTSSRRLCVCHSLSLCYRYSLIIISDLHEYELSAFVYSVRRQKQDVLAKVDCVYLFQIAQGRQPTARIPHLARQTI